MTLDNPEQVKTWLEGILTERRLDIIVQWEAADTRDAREDAHAALKQLETLREAIHVRLDEQSRRG